MVQAHQGPKTSRSSGSAGVFCRESRSGTFCSPAVFCFSRVMEGWLYLQGVRALLHLELFATLFWSLCAVNPMWWSPAVSASSVTLRFTGFDADRNSWRLVQVCPVWQFYRWFESSVVDGVPPPLEILPPGGNRHLAFLFRDSTTPQAMWHVVLSGSKVELHSGLSY